MNSPAACPPPLLPPAEAPSSPPLAAKAPSVDEVAAPASVLAPLPPTESPERFDPIKLSMKGGEALTQPLAPAVVDGLREGVSLALESLVYAGFTDADRIVDLNQINAQHNPKKLQGVEWGMYLEQQTVHAGLIELVRRLGDDIPNLLILSLATCTAYALTKPTKHEEDLQNELDSALYVLGVVWASRPNHYTLTWATRPDFTNPWKFCFWDPYHHFLKTSHNAAERLGKNLGLLAETTALPKNEPGPQKDGWSCGLQVISKVEALMREWRKEGPTSLVPIEEVAFKLNEYLFVCCSPFFLPLKASDGQAVAAAKLEL